MGWNREDDMAGSRRPEGELVSGEVRKPHDQRIPRVKWFQDPDKPVSDWTLVKSFVVEQVDSDGTVHRSVAEIAASEAGGGFTGVLSNGDYVSFYVYERTKGGTVVTKAIRNHTLGGSLVGDRRLIDQRKIDLPPA
jgi:hypothetical protein